MKKALAVAFVGALFAGIALAQPTIELDLDNVLGNGPDVAVAIVSDYITVDVWVVGSAPSNLISANVTLCNLDGSLEFQGYAYAVAWTNTAPQVNPPCVLLQSTDFAFVGLAIPFLHGTATYHAAVDNSLDDLTIDGNQSGWFSYYGGTGLFNTGNVGGSVQIGGSATEESSWGAVKGLFR